MKNIRQSEIPGSHRGSFARDDHFAVILAGGDGSRLRSLTSLISGDDRPKQFCPLIGERSLLERTRERVAALISRENTFFSLTRKHERFYQAPLWDARPEQLVVQPANKGTAPAILFSLFAIVRKDPDAIVGFFPSDHYFANDAAFLEHLRSAYSAAEMNSESVILLGIEPEKPETAYGWIEPSESLFGEMKMSFSRVARFWEKPSLSGAKKLMSEGCLWNSFVMVGKAKAFLDLFRQYLPDMFRMFDMSKDMIGKGTETSVITAIYSWLNETNFSTGVLEPAASKLIVMRVADVGWCDWGEPNRVIGTLSSLGIKPDWIGAVGT